MPVDAEGRQIKSPTEETIDRLHGEAQALVNALTALVIATGDVIPGGFERQLKPADMDRIGGHLFTMTQDDATKVITLRARKKDASSSALTAAQLLDNRRAAEVALPHDKLIKPPTGIIKP